MGEFGTVNGERVKIGTCEDFYYLRADQRDQVSGYDFGAETLAVVRFRFPFPDEDSEPVGGFDDPDRGLRLDGFEQPAEVEHGTTQFTANYPKNGYVVSLPCPEGPENAYRLGVCERGANNGLHKLTIHRNGYGGPASLVQQAYRGGRWVGIVRCNGCGTRYRLEDGFEDAAAVSIRARGDKEIALADRNAESGTPTEGDRATGRFFHEVADRLLAGYAVCDHAVDNPSCEHYS